MADVHDQETRRRNMAAVRGKNTKPEMVLRAALHARGFRYRLHAKELAGRPDLVLPRWHAAVFVHGCFWHGHNCPAFVWPKTRPEFWADKIHANRARDAKSAQTLMDQGWRMAVVWECALKGKAKPPLTEVIDSVASWISSDTPYLCVEGQFLERPDSPIA